MKGIVDDDYALLGCIRNELNCQLVLGYPVLNPTKKIYMRLYKDFNKYKLDHQYTDDIEILLKYKEENGFSFSTGSGMYKHVESGKEQPVFFELIMKIEEQDIADSEGSVAYA